jgi:hypothetical protein
MKTAIAFNVLAYHLGKRTARAKDAFTGKLAYATPQVRCRLTSDGFGPYVSAVKMPLRDRVDFAQLIKVCGSPRDGEQQYSPAEAVDSVPVEIMGGRLQTASAHPTSNGKTSAFARA